jgi:CheY-like chemotaxis protein
MVELEGLIMLVEDSEDERAMLRFAFGKAGVRNPVREFHNGDEAIEYLSGEGEYADRERYPLPCLIITDLKMPGVDGFELLDWLRKHPEFDPVPKLVLSNSLIESDARRARELGACEFFVKPGQFDQLIRTVAEMNEDWISEHCPLT